MNEYGTKDIFSAVSIFLSLFYVYVYVEHHRISSCLKKDFIILIYLYIFQCLPFLYVLISTIGI